MKTPFVMMIWMCFKSVVLQCRYATSKNRCCAMVLPLSPPPRDDARRRLDDIIILFFRTTQTTRLLFKEREGKCARFCGENRFLFFNGISEEEEEEEYTSKKKKKKTKRFSCDARSGNCTTTRNQSFENTWRRRAGRRGRADPKGP